MFFINSPNFPVKYSQNIKRKHKQFAVEKLHRKLFRIVNYHRLRGRYSMGSLLCFFSDGDIRITRHFGGITTTIDVTPDIDTKDEPVVSSIRFCKRS